MRAIGFPIGRRTRFYVWAGSWSIFDRNGGSKRLFSLKPCACHTFSLYIGPFGLEVQ